MKCIPKSHDCVSQGTCTPGVTPEPGICSQPKDSQADFKVKTHYHGDCTGVIHNDVVIESNTNGRCVDIDCQVASLDIDAVGNCPDGQVRISYWQNSGCSGEWYGYGYSSKDTCRGLWKQGWATKSLWLQCAEESQDCITTGSCQADPEPAVTVCQ